MAKQVIKVKANWNDLIYHPWTCDACGAQLENITTEKVDLRKVTDNGRKSEGFVSVLIVPTEYGGCGKCGAQIT